MSAAIEFLPRDRAPEPADRVFDSIVELAPNPDHPTPMVRLSGRLNPNPDYEVLVKLEGMNPFGSIKDRTALYLLNGLDIREGQVLAEPTAGNTGIALAALAFLVLETALGRWVSRSRRAGEVENIEFGADEPLAFGKGGGR